MALFDQRMLSLYGNGPVGGLLGAMMQVGPRLPGDGFQDQPTSSYRMGDVTVPVFGTPAAPVATGEATLPANAQPTQGQLEQPGFGDRLGAALQGFASGGGLLPALARAAGGFATGVRQDPAGIAERTLVQRGIDPQLARLVASDPATLRGVVSQLVGSKDMTDEIKEYNLYRQQAMAAGRQPLSFFDYKVNLKREGATRVTQVNQGENSYDKAMGEQFAKKYGSIVDSGDKAFTTLGSLQVMRGAMDDPAFSSGIGAERFALPLKQAIAALGGDPSGAASMEIFRSQANKSVLDSMGGSLGTGFSNADRDFVVSQVPSLGNTPAGNRALISVIEKIERRKIEVARLAQEYVQRNGRLDAGFDRQLTAFKEANPLFTSQERSAITRAKAAAPSNAPTLRYNPKTRQMESAQ